MKHFFPALLLMSAGTVNAAALQCGPSQPPHGGDPQPVSNPYEVFGYAGLAEISNVTDAWIWGGIDQKVVARADIKPANAARVVDWLASNKFVLSSKSDDTVAVCDAWTDLAGGFSAAKRYERELPGRSETITIIEFTGRGPVLVMNAVTY